jgi:hypothetical protein
MNSTQAAMDVTPILPWVTGAISVITLGMLLKTIFGSGAKELALKIELQTTKLTEHDRRVQRLESAFEHLPSKDNVHKQQLDISDMKGEIGIIKKSIETTERTTRRVEEFLIKGDGK